jgi:hypothetical protein
MTQVVLGKFNTPPPDIAQIVEKTAEFIGKNGNNFEKKILTKEANNPKFDFLKEESPYNQYYRHVLHQYLTKAGFFVYRNIYFIIEILFSC